MRSNCGIRISESGITTGQCCALSIRNPQSAIRNGTTLIELLITITIITILSATFLGVSNLAMESAREARTKTTIGKIHGLLMEKWNSYATRRVDVNTTGLSTAQRRNGRFMADLRLLGTRELMKLEMPDRWSDLTNTANSILAVGYPEVLTSYPALTKSYLRRYQTSASITTQNQGAECLYMIIMLGTADGEARTLFSEQDIGDVDDDGAPELLDGWGKPISFIRWPAGFVGESDLMSGDADADHDPFDVFRRDQEGVIDPPFGFYPGTASLGPRSHIEVIRNRNNTQNISAFRLVPLIYSSGSDAESGILTSKNTIIGLDPYFHVLSALTAPSGFIGSPVVDNGVITTDHLDNIHNHLQDNK